RRRPPMSHLSTRAAGGGGSGNAETGGRRAAAPPPADPPAGDRRPANRRSRPEIDAELRASGFAFVRSQTRPDVGRAGSSRGEQGHPPTLGRAPSAVEPPRLSPFRRASGA